MYFIADTHFGHENIIAYENRPFDTVEEMDRVMIENWNTVVKAEDEVFVLGDFSFYGKDRNTEICRKLNGRKILVMGNHDTNEPDYYKECGFQQVNPYPIIIDEFWMLSHEPLYINSNMPYANLYGHVHSNPIYADYSKQSFCACVERIDYTPISFSNIKQLMKVES